MCATFNSLVGPRSTVDPTRAQERVSVALHPLVRKLAPPLSLKCISLLVMMQNHDQEHCTQGKRGDQQTLQSEAQSHHNIV
mmetsp:Transcript_44164/g.109758  ORF Transcript_44164/g.109758 Transcript_44164/m.109758 type:complete len:81 (+) Transcript_44164:93-335(+)